MRTGQHDFFERIMNNATGDRRGLIMGKAGDRALASLG
jgi:hypothetical protein